MRTALFVPAPPAWPALELVREAKAALPGTSYVRDDRAELRFGEDQSITIERSPIRATFTMPASIPDEELVHPYLAPVAGIVARWLGRETLHAGGLALDGGLWGLIADKEGGKSSTLGYLALNGYAVVCDDLLVVRDSIGFAGPRCVDLRSDAARALGEAEPLSVYGARGRSRLALGPVPPELPLRGWAFLAWGDRVEVAPVPAPERLRRIAANRSVRLEPADPAGLLRLAALPAWEIRRPRRWDSLGETVARLIGVITG